MSLDDRTISDSTCLWKPRCLRGKWIFCNGAPWRTPRHVFIFHKGAPWSTSSYAFNWHTSKIANNGWNKSSSCPNRQPLSLFFHVLPPHRVWWELVSSFRLLLDPIRQISSFFPLQSMAETKSSLCHPEESSKQKRRPSTLLIHIPPPCRVRSALVDSFWLSSEWLIFVFIGSSFILFTVTSLSSVYTEPSDKPTSVITTPRLAVLLKSVL